MKKRLLAFALALVAASAIVIFGYRAVKEETSKRYAIGVGRITGAFLPFFEPSDGDRAIRTLTLLPLTETAVDGTVTTDGACAAAKREIFYTDRLGNRTSYYPEGGFTAVKYTLKDGVMFSNGTAMTAGDVVFSLYGLLDPLSGGDRSAFSRLSGYDDYYYGIEGISQIIEDAGKMIVSGDEDIEDFVTGSGELFANHIRDLVISRFCTDEMVSSHILEGMTADEVRSSDALSWAYTVRMWNYGAFIYSYEPDENGDYVGTVSEDGTVTYRTTYAAAMEDDTYTEYVPSLDGDLVIDLFTGRYVAPPEGERGVYKKVLSDKYARLRHSSIIGFRDSDGEVWTLEDGSYPDADRFFLLMRKAHTSEGVFDYAGMERTESADTFSFSSDAAINYARSRAVGGEVTEISGVRENGGEITLYFEGSDVDAASRANFYIVSKSACLDGYDFTSDTLSAAGAPKGSESFRDHLSSISSNPVSAGQYTVESYNDGDAALSANGSFATVSGSVAGFSSLEVRDITGTGAPALIGSGEIFMSFTPLTVSDVAGLPEGVAAILCPNDSYKYLMINPGVYKNVEARRAIASTVDPSVTVTTGKVPLSRVVPSYHAYYAGETESLFDPTGKTALAHFANAGYTVNDEGILIDPATRAQAYFTFRLLPEEREGDAEAMIEKSLSILKSIGADGEIVYDTELKTSVFSDGYVPLYVLGWEVGHDLSTYERYAVSSASGTVAATGLDSLASVGVTEATGLVNGMTEAEAVGRIDELLTSAKKTTDFEKIKDHTVEAEELITALTFEIPLHEYADVFLVKVGVIDPGTFPAKFSSARSPLSDMYKLKPLTEE